MLLNALSACSFRKNKQHEEVSQNPTIKVATLDQKVSENSEADLISEFSSMNNDSVERLKDKDGLGVIDLAILFKRKDLLVYLLERDLSPFKYTQSTAEILSKDPVYNSIIASYQNAGLTKILRDYKNGLNQNDLSAKLATLNFQSPSCVKLLEEAFNSYYFQEKILTLQSFEGMERTEVIQFYKDLSSTRSCSGLSDQIAPNQFTNWYIQELLKQVGYGFNSYELLTLIESFGSIKDLSINVTVNGNILRIDPRLLIFIGTDKMDLSQKKDWLNRISSHVNQSPFFYHIFYVDAHAKNFLDIDCDSKDSLCESNTSNKTAIAKIIKYLKIEVSKDEPEVDDSSANDTSRVDMDFSANDKSQISDLENR